MHRHSFTKSLLVSLLACQAAWASGDTDPGGGGPGARTAGQNFFRDEYAVNVDPAAGAFSTRVEIRVPKYHGLEPKLALQYSSSAGNGFVGVGWKLEGISYIERITPDGGTPTYVDATDTFALDGEELLPCTFGGSGNYCTRVHSFQRIVRNGPNWEITTKDGIKSVYTPLINGTPSKTFRWALASVTDRQTTQNTVTYEYQCGVAPSDCYPWRILYNQTQILFERSEARDDVTSYSTGVGLRTIGARLTGIDIEVDGDRARHYMLTYKSIAATAGEWSLLEKVQHLGTNNDFNERLPELVYDYEIDSSIVFERDEDNVTLDAGGEFLSGDYNGDQRTDLLYLPPGTPTTNRSIYLLTARTNVGTPNFDMTAESVPNVPAYPQLHEGDWIQGDFDRNGLSDLAHAHEIGGIAASNLWIWYRQPNGTFNRNTATPSLSEAAALNKGRGRWIAGDWNGDGRTDLLHASSQNNKVYIWMMDGDFTVQVSVLATIASAHQGWWLPADVDGDGNTDVVNVRNSTITTWRSQGDGTFDASDAYPIPAGYPEPFNVGVWRTGDFNADGKTDLVHFGDDPQIQVLYRVADASSGGVYTWASIPVPTTPSPYPYTADGWWFTVDINGDGITDFYNVTNDQTLRIWRSNGAAGAYTHSVEDPPSGYPPLWAGPLVTTIKWASGDFDGNGRDDLVHVVHPALGSDEIWTWTADNQAETPPNPATPNQLGNRIKSIKNRTGGTTKVTYQPSSKPNITNAYLPVGMIMHPVKTLETNNGLTPATIHTTTYGFEKGLWSSDERCFLGFEVSRRFHEAAGTAGSYEETTLDRTVANCINPASKVAQKKPAGTAGVYTDDQFFSFTDFVHEVDTTRPYQALELERTVNECNLTSNLSNCRKVETETQYDQYANVTRVVERGDIGFTGDERTTVTTFGYNVGNFIVDRPSQESVYVGALTSGTGTVAADTLFKYDTPPAATPTTGNLTEREVWDSAAGVYRKTGFGYDNRGNVTSETSPRGYAEGNVAAFTTTTTYDATFHIFPDVICKPLGLCVDQDWQARREVLTQEVDLANGLTTTYDYDIFGRLRFVHHPDLTQTEYAYWDIGTPINQQFIYISVPDDTADGLIQQVYLDGFAREWKVVKEGGAQQLTTYHENSDRIATQTRWHFTSEAANPTTFVYDGAKRLFETNEPGRTLPIRNNYELLANPALPGSVLKPVVRQQDHLGEEKYTWLDAYGRVSAVREIVVGGTYNTSFTYDVLDNLDIVTDALGNTANYDFDSLSRKTYVCDFDLGCWDFVHDANGNVVSQTDARTVATASTYDALDRIKTRVNADGTTTWTYDELAHGFSKGKLTSLSYPGGTESYTWDNMGFQSGITRCVAGVCRPLTLAFTKSRLDTVTYPDSEVVNYDYDNAGNVSTVVSSTGGTLAGPITWNARNQIELAPYGNGTTTDPSYHASFDVLGSTSVSGTSGTIYQATYTYDQAVRVDLMTSTTNDEANLDFGYDALDRLLTVAPLGAATQSQTFTYSAIGNVLTNSQIGGGTFQYTSGKPHAIAHAGSRYYGYDNNGNTTSVTTRTPDCVTVDRLMQYDATNRLSWVASGGVTTSYRYDADGQRISKSGPGGNTHYYGKYFELEDPTGAARLVKYYYLGDDLLARSESGARLWYHLDHVGSVRAMSAQDGTRSVAYEYAAFGDTIETIGSADNLRGFGSHWRDDESHLVYMSARYQDPVIGRFAQPDTIVPEPGDPQSWNRYSYVRNNPVNRIDPSGHADYYWKEGSATPRVDKEDEPGINDFVEGANGSRVFDNSTYFPAPQDVADVNDYSGGVFNGVVSEEATASLIDGIIAADEAGYQMINPMWGAGIVEFGMSSREGEDYDYKHGNPFTAGTWYVFEGQAFSFDYAGNVAWAAQGSNRGIPGAALHLGAQGQSLGAHGVLDSSWDQHGIARGVRWSTRGR